MTVVIPTAVTTMEWQKREQLRRSEIQRMWSRVFKRGRRLGIMTITIKGIIRHRQNRKGSWDHLIMAADYGTTKLVTNRGRDRGRDSWLTWLIRPPPKSLNCRFRLYYDNFFLVLPGLTSNPSICSDRRPTVSIYCITHVPFLTIACRDSEDVVQCQVSLITWSGGVREYSHFFIRCSI